MGGLCIVALPVGNATVTYKEDGSTAPLHQTLVYLGDAEAATFDRINALGSAISEVARVTRAFPAQIIGGATLGEFQEDVVLTSSDELLNVRDRLLLDDTVRGVFTSVKQHPGYVSHISGMVASYGDWVVFDRLALWAGEDKYEFRLQ